jgi:hypothetical protein
MTDDDRRKLFWYIKRKTSLSAWKRESDAFDAFAIIFKKQVVEQPHAPGGLFGPVTWDAYYPEILRTQAQYEQGLSRLGTGDRTVWLYSARGILRDAIVVSNIWYTELIYGGERGDHNYYGKYLDEMKIAITYFNKTQGDAGFVQSMMAETPAPIFWGEWIECALNNEIYPRNPEPGFPQGKYSSLIQYPTPLPDVPVEEEEILIKTGDNIPEYGIYEPQVKDGCMNYLLKDTPAPLLSYAGEDDRPVVWRLIWKDLRYLDGNIPAEERTYFPEEEQARVSIDSDLISPTTGEHNLNTPPIDGGQSIVPLWKAFVLMATLTAAAVCVLAFNVFVGGALFVAAVFFQTYGGLTNPKTVAGETRLRTAGFVFSWLVLVFLAGLVQFIAPAFASVFASFGADLPEPTKVTMASYPLTLFLPFLVGIVWNFWPRPRSKLRASLILCWCCVGLVLLMMSCLYLPIFKLGAVI